MQQMDMDVSKRYGFEIQGIIPYKDAYILNTASGKKLFKKSALSRERILFVHGAKEHIFSNGFKNIDRYMLTVEGQPCFEADNMSFTVSNMIEGVECNLNNRNDVINAAGALAQIHKASKGYTAPLGSYIKDELGNHPYNLCKRLNEIRKLKKIASKGKSAFDYMVYNHIDYFYDLGADALSQMSMDAYKNIVCESRKDGIICHHDYSHSNIICNSEMWITGFEYCCFDLKVYDIANFLRRKMRKCSWNINEAKIIIEEYKKVEGINENELLIMKVMLQFPQKFWRIINRYYNSRHSWCGKLYTKKLLEVIEEIDCHKHFIDNYSYIV